jgi:uncharacterized protein (TIGR04255 family)
MWNLVENRGQSGRESSSGAAGSTPAGYSPERGRVFPAKYNKPPIVEAVVELQFAPAEPWTPQSLGRLVERFRPFYPGVTQRRKQVQLHIEGEAVSTSEMTVQHVMLPSADQRAVVGLGQNLLSVHVLAPYPGWESFYPRVVEGLDLYRDAIKVEAMTRIGVRYVDQITIAGPAEGLNLLDYFPYLPRRPAGMPQTLDAFHVMAQSHDDAENLTATLAMASTQSPEGVTLLYDLNVLRMFSAPAPFAELGTHASFLHDKQRFIFEHSITDKTRELFA